MCGIAGIIHFDRIAPIDNETLMLMSKALRHRGPDGDGTYSDNNVALAHRRLSVIDLSSKAYQPMKSRDGNILIVFNGEIYNHQELRNELEKEFDFATDHSDTEVIIYAFKKWGIDCIHRFNGMFAFAVYDKLNKNIFLVRDRLGKKPLYFVASDSRVYFSSEIQSFFNANILSKETNWEAVYNYLTFLTINAPSTFYKNIEKLESGHYLEISARGHIKKIKYWDVADFLNTECNDSYATACSVTDELLKNSMAYRNISDVPVSIALSGGIDSSLNLYYSSKINQNLLAINISYVQEGPYDESEAARTLCKDSNTAFINKKVDSHFLKALIMEYLSIQRDMPIGDPNAVLVYLLSKIAKQNGAKVLLVGEGGDELGGYPVYIQLEKESGMSNTLSFILRNFKFVFSGGKVIYKRHIHGFGEHEKKKFWNGDKGFDSYRIFSSYLREIRDDLEDSFLRKLLSVEYKLRLPEMILSRVDYPSMAGSIEARSPFMDHKLIEYSCTLPFSAKMKKGPKSIIKDIAANKIPSYIIQRPKVGFGMLLTPFLEDTMPAWFKNDLLDQNSKLSEFLNMKRIKSIYEEHKRTKKAGYKMWILYALNNWLEINGF
jgi:asparagine synthase (glutamine-hydrolysing)